MSSSTGGSVSRTAGGQGGVSGVRGRFLPHPHPNATHVHALRKSAPLPGTPSRKPALGHLPRPSLPLPLSARPLAPSSYHAPPVTSVPLPFRHLRAQGSPLQMQLNPDPGPCRVRSPGPHPSRWIQDPGAGPGHLHLTSFSPPHGRGLGPHTPSAVWTNPAVYSARGCLPVGYAPRWPGGVPESR